MNSAMLMWIDSRSFEAACTSSESTKSVVRMLSAMCLNIFFEREIMSSTSLRDKSMFLISRIEEPCSLWLWMFEAA